MARKKKKRVIPDVLLFTDINNYHDDLASLVVLTFLADHKLINIRGIITELGNFEIRRRRAMYAKGALAHLGYPYVRVAPGGDYDFLDLEKENYFLENEFSKLFEAGGTAILRSGTTFLQEYFKSVKERNIIVVLNAPFTDFVKYMKATGDIAFKKIKKIVVMGNVVEQESNPKIWKADPECFNFKTGYPAAQYLLDAVQEKNVTLTVVPTQTVKDVHMKDEFLQAVAASKNPVAQLLRQVCGDNPLSLQYDMVSVLAVAAGVFRNAGGVIEKVAEDCSIEIASVENSELMREKFCEIFKNKLLPKKITLDQLRQSKQEDNHG